MGGPPTPRVLKVNHVDVEGATGVGVALIDSGFVTGSTSLVVHGSGFAPVYLGADVVDTLPDGTYTGNTADAIGLNTAYFAGHNNTRPILSDVTFHDRGVPYCVGMKEPSQIVVGAQGVAPPLVTFEPGVVVGFLHGSSPVGRINVLGDTTVTPTRALGALAAVGTATKPVVFTSCEPTPAAGDWIGITIAGLDARTSFQNAGITNAGAPSGVIGACLNSAGNDSADAALQILLQDGAPTASFVTATAILDSAGNGIHRGWRGADVDFLAGNSLMRIALCAQTNVPDTLNACPTTTCPTAP